MRIDLTLLLQLVGFGILLFLLNKFVLGRVIAMLDERRQSIEKKLEEADSLKRQAEKERKEAETHLLETKKQALRIKEEAFLYSERVKEEKARQAEADAARTATKAQEELDASVARAREALTKYSADLSFEIAEKIVGAEVDRKKHAKLVEESIRQLNEEREFDI